VNKRIGILAFLAITVVLAACSSGTGSPEWTPLPSGAEPPAACARADADGVIAISADQLAFSAPCMVAPPGVAIVVRFTNDEAEPHNVAIYTDPSRETSITVGDTISGPEKTVDYPVEALAAGDY
jgi:plastocyanin